MTKKYWNGSIRLFSDLCWCFVLIFVLNIVEKKVISIPEFIGSTLGMFFFIFFWSWNKEHLKSHGAKIGIHILTGLFGLMLPIVLFIFFSNPMSFLSSYIGWYLLVMPSVWTFFVFRKYKRLMWAKPLKTQ